MFCCTGMLPWCFRNIPGDYLLSPKQKKLLDTISGKTSLRHRCIPIANDQNPRPYPSPTWIWIWIALPPRYPTIFHSLSRSCYWLIFILSWLPRFSRKRLIQHGLSFRSQRPQARPPLNLCACPGCSLRSAPPAALCHSRRNIGTMCEPPALGGEAITS